MCYGEQCNRLVEREAALFTPGYEYVSAIPQTRQAILTALYRDTGYRLAQSALVGDPYCVSFCNCYMGGTIIAIRAHGRHKNLHIPLFFLPDFGYDYYFIYSLLFYQKCFLRTSAVSSMTFGSLLIFASCVVGTCNILCGSVFLSGREGPYYF